MYQSLPRMGDAPTLRDLEKAGVQIFNDWWSTYIPEHRQTLERKIMHTYYFEEIGCETPDRFVHYLNTHLERIMPYYNQLYASELIKINPMLNHSIEVNGRSIENLLKKANTTDDKFAKAIRDFAGVTDKAGIADASGTKDIIGHRTDDGSVSYTKSGTEDIIDNTDSRGTEVEEELTVENKDFTGHETNVSNTTQNGDRNLDRTVTETPNEKTVKEMDWGATEKGSEKVVGKDISSGSGTNEWTETLNDNTNTDTVTHLEEDTTANATKDYADTPQKKLDTGKSAVRRDYLTNSTWTDDTSHHESDTTQNVEYNEEQTKNHNGTTTDENTTDKTQDITSNKEKGGTDTETATHTGTNVTETDEHETNNVTTDVNGTKDNTDSTTSTSDSDRNLNTTQNTDYTRDKEWTEKGQSTEHMDSDTISNEKTVSHSNTSDNISTRENANMSQSSVNTQSKTSEETNDTGSTTVTSGFMNVSSSALLEAFRKTFVNIDEMIVKELRDNFMLVY